MDFMETMQSMKGKTVSEVGLLYTEGEGETLIITFTDDTKVNFYADDFRTEK